MGNIRDQFLYLLLFLQDRCLLLCMDMADSVESFTTFAPQSVRCAFLGLLELLSRYDIVKSLLNLV